MPLLFLSTSDASPEEWKTQSSSTTTNRSMAFSPWPHHFWQDGAVRILSSQQGFHSLWADTPSPGLSTQLLSQIFWVLMQTQSTHLFFILNTTDVLLSSLPPSSTGPAVARHGVCLWASVGRGQRWAGCSEPPSCAENCTLHCSNAALLSSQQIPEVKTRFSPNPSAVFQAPSRILNV
uniref:Uncharacterized protein n=1 Tax=Meleagris gallopavo TaxID=9103 RepID=A0A803Y4K8_MELGA